MKVMYTSAARTKVDYSELGTFNILDFIEDLDDQVRSHVGWGRLLYEGQSVSPFCCQHGLAAAPEKG